MKTSYIFLSNSFEDIEALAVIDILRRAQVPIISVSMEESVQVTTSHAVTVLADALFSDIDFTDADTLILPGGSPRLNEFDNLKALLSAHHGRIAAICAAPMVLGGLGLLNGKRATCYPGFEKYLTGAELVTAPVVVDGNITTGNGPAAALAFSYALVEQICGIEKANTLRLQMGYK